MVALFLQECLFKSPGLKSVGYGEKQQSLAKSNLCEVLNVLKFLAQDPTWML